MEVKQKKARDVVFSTKLDTVTCSMNFTSYYFIIIIEQWSSMAREGDFGPPLPRPGTLGNVWRHFQ